MKTNLLPNTQTDAWSFAVIALQLLTHTHPFNHGIAVEDEEPDIAEEKAARGEFPWVFDVDDDSNEIAVSGFPVFEMLNKRLFNNVYLWGALAAGLFLPVISPAVFAR